MAASSCSSRSWLRAFSKTSTGAFAVSLIGRECRLRLPWQACRSGRCAARRELKRFVKVPFRLHRDHPQWVAPLIFERMQFLNRKKNP